MTDAPENLSGMSAAQAKEYIGEFITTLKLTEKEILSLKAEASKWNDRVELAREIARDFASEQGKNDLLAEAEKEAERVNAKLAVLTEEENSLKVQIENMRRQLPGLAARERSIDADLLEQELLMALGKTEEEAAAEKAFRKLEKESSADAALEALKAKMRDTP